MLGLRAGFFLGFLIGAAASSLLSEPASDGRGTFLDEIKRAAREAAAAKEAEMRRQYHEATHPNERPPFPRRSQF
jgi:hypothetical protein